MLYIGFAVILIGVVMDMRDAKYGNAIHYLGLAIVFVGLLTASFKGSS